MVDSIFVPVYDDAANCAFSNQRHIEKLFSNRPNAVLRLLCIIHCIRGDTTSCTMKAITKLEAMVVVVVIKRRGAQVWCSHTKAILL